MSKAISSMQEFNSLTSSNDKLSLAYFTAAWCGPCKSIAPIYEASASANPQLLHFKIDVDKSPDVSALYSISSMPTFIILRGKTKVEELKGANPPALKALVAKYAAIASTVSASSGSSGAVEKGLEGFNNVNSSIDLQQISCSNESSTHTVRDLLKGGGDKWLESDSDEQLILFLPMNQSIRLRAIRFTTLPSVIDQAPKKIRLFLNNRNLGFDDAESLEPAQEIELTKAQGSGVEAVQLRFVKFQTVQTLAIFVENNQGGGDVTRIDKLELIGTNGETSDWSNFNKPEE